MSFSSRYEAKQRKIKAAKERKTVTLTKLIATIDAEIDRAIKSDAYHVAEVEQLNKARSCVFAVRAGYVKRQRY